MTLPAPAADWRAVQESRGVKMAILARGNASIIPKHMIIHMDWGKICVKNKHNPDISLCENLPKLLKMIATWPGLCYMK